MRTKRKHICKHPICIFFIFTTASTSSAVRLLPLSCDFFNQLSIEQNLTSSSGMVV